MNTRKQTVSRKGSKRYAFTILICLSIIITAIISFLIAAQLILFPSNSDKALTEEKTNIALQQTAKTKSGDATEPGIDSVRDPFLPNNDVNQNFDSLKPLSTGLSDLDATPENMKLESIPSTIPDLKKSNEALSRLSKNKVKKNNGRTLLKPTSTLTTTSPKTQTNLTGKELVLNSAIVSGKKINQDLESPPQEEKESIVVPSIEINQGSGLPVETAIKMTYIAKSNETVNSIAGKFGVSPESICEENELTGLSEKVAEGKTVSILIPGNRLYRLKSKETLWRLAQRYGTTVEILKEINNINDITKIKAGEQIILPVAVNKIVNNKY